LNHSSAAYHISATSMKLFIISHSKHFFHILEALHIVNHSTSH
jgi:hypothetical protein